VFDTFVGIIDDLGVLIVFSSVGVGMLDIRFWTVEK